MDVRLLGPVEVSVDDGPVAIGATKQRALLAMLALDAGAAVSAERLIDGLWGDEPPASAPKMVQLYVSQLRKALGGHGDAEIVTRGRGYELRLGRERGRRAAASSGCSPQGARRARRCAVARAAARRRRRRAVRRARDPAAGGAARARARARDRRRTSTPGATRGAAGARGAARAAAAARAPARAADARALPLRAARPRRSRPTARRAPTLVEQIGVEPGPELRRLHEAILRQDPSLDLAGPAERRPARRRTPLVGRDERARAPARALAPRARRRRRERARHRRRRASARRGSLQELADEVRRGRRRARVAGARSGRRRGGHAERPTLLVVDDAGTRARSPPRPGAGRARRPCSCSRRRETLPSCAPLGRDDVAAARARPRGDARRDARSTPPVDRAARRERRRARRACTARRARGRGRGRRGASARRRRGRRPSARGWQLAERRRSPTRSSSCRRCASARRRPPRRPRVACPFKGLALVRRRGRGGLLRPRAARRRDGRAAGRRAAAGHRRAVGQRQVLGRCAPGCWPRSRDGVLPGSERWAHALLRPGEHPLAALERAIADAARARPAGPRRRPVRGALHGLPRRGGARRVRRRARRLRARPAPARARADRRARRLLRPLRAPTPSCRGCSAPTTCWSARCAATSCAARSSCPPRRAGLRVEPELVDALVADVEGEPGRAAAALDRAARALAAARRPAAAPGRLRARGRRARRRRAAGRGAYERPRRRRAARRARGSCCGSPATARATPSCAGACRSPSSADADAARSSRVLADERLRHGRRGRGRGRARGAAARVAAAARAGSRRTPRAAALHRHLSVAARDWDAGGRDPGELYRGARLAAALEWAAAHDARAQRRRARVPRRRAARPSERAQRRLRAVLAGVARAARARGRRRRRRARAARQRARRRRRARTRSGSARARSPRTTSTARCCSRARASRSTTRAQTRGNLLAALLKSPAAIGVMRGDGERFSALALSPDERTLAAGDPAGNVFLFDTRTRRRVAGARPCSRATGGSSSSPSAPTAAASRSPTTARRGTLVTLIDTRSAPAAAAAGALDSGGVITGRGSPARQRSTSPATRRDAEARTAPTVARYDARSGRRVLGPLALVTRRRRVLATRDGRAW